MSIDPGRPVRWGILGAGGIAAIVGGDIQASNGSEVVAVGARDAARAAEFAAGHGIPRSYGSYDDLLADADVDVVYIATTHGQHREHALLALRAGKPLLVEKAFTLNAAEAREVVAEARSRELFCMEAMWLRLNPLVAAAAEAVRSGRLGEITVVKADLSRRFEYDPAHRLFDLSVGGGALLDLGVYPIAFAWEMLGRPSSVHAVGELSPTGSDLTSALTFGYESGAVAQVFTSAASTSPDASLVVGTEGWLRLDPRVHRPQTLTIHTAEGHEVIHAEPDPGNGYHHQVAEVERCLRGGLTESPRIPLDSTVEILELIDEARSQLGVRYPAEA